MLVPNRAPRPSPQEFLTQSGSLGNRCEQVARKWLQKVMQRHPHLKVRWRDKDVSPSAKGTLGYVEWSGDELILSVPYPRTPYQLEVFLHEVGHLWVGHSPETSCNGRVSNCRPTNREEYEAETFAMKVMREEQIPFNDPHILSDAQDNVVANLFRDLEEGLPISRDAVKFAQLNDQLKTHKGWENFLEDLGDAKMINPARTPEQYRLAQAVLHGTVRGPSHMSKAVAEEMIRKTPAHLRSEWSKYTVSRANPAEAAEQVYEEFHGSPSEGYEEIAQEEHYHAHLAELGVLMGLKFRTPDGEHDVTLDFACDGCERGQSGNLFGFGGKKTSGSSRLMREAFEEGYNGSGGYRGTEEFREWLQHATGDQQLTRSFKKSLQREYMRGMHNWQKEGEVAASLGRKKTGRSAALARGTKFAHALARSNPPQSPNLFGLGKESGLKKTAYNIGYNTMVKKHFTSWLQEEQERGTEIDAALKKKLLAAFWKGTDRRYEEFKKEEKRQKIAEHENPHSKGPLESASDFAGSFVVPWKQKLVRGVDTVFTGNPPSEWMEYWGHVHRTYTVAWRRKKLKGMGEVVQYAVSKGRPHNVVKEFGEDKEAAIAYAQRMQEEDDRRYGFSRRNPDDGDEGGEEEVYLCANEDKNQLYLIGGDQSVEVEDLQKDGVDPHHDSLVLGECWAVNYVTAKEFDDFQEIEYVHTFGPEDLQAHMPQKADLWEDAKPPHQDAFHCGVLPTLRYDVLNQTLHLDGGSYYVTDKGIEE